jgi:hypothetical protein
MYTVRFWRNNWETVRVYIYGQNLCETGENEVLISTQVSEGGDVMGRVKLFANQEDPFRKCLQTMVRMMNLSTVLEMTLEIVLGTTIRGSGNLAEFAVHQDRGGQIALSSQPQPIQPPFTKQ